MINLNLKELTIEELEILKTNVLKERESRITKKVIYTHDCFGSSNYHMNKYKHFSKKLTGIDESKTNGYAFSGDFLSVECENLVTEGSYIVEVCMGIIKLYKASDNEKELLLKGNSGAYVSFIRKAKEITGL